MTDTAERAPAPALPNTPGGNGHARQAEGAPPSPTAPGAPSAPPATSSASAGAPTAALPATPRPRNRLRIAAFVVLGIGALIGAAVAGYRFWYDSNHFVSTNNAQIAGRLIQVGGLAPGRIVAVRYDIGDRVERDAVVAVLQVPIAVGTTSSGVPRMEFRPTSDSLIEVRAPISGVVVARSATAGDTVPAGQTVLTLVDPEQLWVNANIEETQVRRVEIGQATTVTVDALGIDLPGRIVAITPASAATFSLLPQQNFSGNYTRVTQLVPVRVALEQPDPRLMIGTSATVRIEVTPR